MGAFVTWIRLAASLDKDEPILLLAVERIAEVFMAWI
jgi:hypothetical protein